MWKYFQHKDKINILYNRQYDKRNKHILRESGTPRECVTFTYIAK